MTRNLDRRVEQLRPIENPSLRKHIVEDALTPYLKAPKAEDWNQTVPIRESSPPLATLPSRSKIGLSRKPKEKASNLNQSKRACSRSNGKTILYLLHANTI